MSEHGFTSDALRQQHAVDITEGNTFKTQGLSVEAARIYPDNTDDAPLTWRTSPVSFGRL